MLRGEKVKLRAVSRDDLPRLLDFYNDVEVELAGGGDPPRPTTLEPPRDKTDFAIEADGNLISHRSLFNIDETARHCELGISIGDKDYWGRGYGRGAVSLLLDYAFRLRNLRRVWLEVHASNERAIRAYSSCGFVEEGRMREHIWLDGRYLDNGLMGILRDEWRR